MRLLIILSLLLVNLAVQSQSTFRSNVASGDWDVASTWIEDVPGTDADGIPDANDDVFIQVGHNVNIPDGTDQRANNLDISRGTVTFLGTTGFLRVTAAFTANSTFATQATITGTTADHRFIVTAAGSFSVSSGSHLELNGVRLTILGTNTTLSGELEFNTSLGTTHSLIDLTIASGGTWTNNTTDNFNISGNLINNSSNTFTPSSTVDGSIYTFNGTTQTISGTGTTTISRLRANTPTVVTNNGTVVMTDDIIGTGEFINGATGDLTLNSSGVFNITTLTLNIVGNIVRHIGATNEVLLSNTYYNLFINMTDETVFCQMNGNDVTVNNDLTIQQGRVRLFSANTLSVSGDIIITNGEFEPFNSEAVITIGGDLSMSGGLFDFNDGDLNVSGDIILSGGTMTMNEDEAPVNPATIDATDMVISGADVTLTEGSLSLSNAAGGLTISSGSLLVNNAEHNLSVTGDFDLSGGSADLNTGTISFVNMDITNAATINVANPIITSTGTITVDNGVFTIDGGVGTYSFNNILVNSSGNWDVTAAYDPTINGNLENNGVFTGCINATGCDYTLTSTSGTISGTGAMNFMSDIIINNTASYTNTNTGGFDITDALKSDVAGGTFINGVNGSMLYGGNNANFTITNFQASSTGNTVTYNRTSSNQTIQPTIDANNDYYNLVINKADGVDVNTTTDITINNQLTLTAGDIIMGNQDLIFASGASISGGNSTSYIQDNANGVIIQTYPIGGDATPLNIPIGDATVYAPMTFTLNSATIPAESTLEFSFDRDAVNGNPNKDNDNSADLGDDDGTPASAFLFGWWTVNVASGSITNMNYSATLDYSNVGFSGTEGLMVPVILRTATPPGGSSTLDWFEVGVNPSRGNASIVSPIVTFSGVNGVENTASSFVLYAMDNQANRLPIDLISFNAKEAKSGIFLEWTTASEEYNEFFTIERSIDGKVFHPITMIPGAGTSEGLLQYSYLDQYPLHGRSFYRLKQTDYNGQFEYSEVVSVVWRNHSNTLDIEIYPNPMLEGNELNISISGLESSHQNMPWTLHLPDGSLVDEGVIHQTDNRINCSNLSKGIYLLHLFADDGQRITRKIVVN